MVDTRGNFDFEAFYRALDGVRRSRNLTWKEVATQSGVAASTLTRMAQGKRPDVDTLATLCGWARLDPTDYMTKSRHLAKSGTATGAEEPADTLALISTCISQDPRLDKQSAAALDSLVKSAYENFIKNRRSD